MIIFLDLDYVYQKIHNYNGDKAENPFGNKEEPSLLDQRLMKIQNELKVNPIIQKFKKFSLIIHFLM